MAARKRYDTAASDAERGQAEMDLRRALMSPRTRLLQRFAQPQGGMGFLVDLRAELLALPKAEQQRFSALDAELEHLFADRKSTRLNSSHSQISYAVFCLKKKNKLDS